MKESKANILLEAFGLDSIDELCNAMGVDRDFVDSLEATKGDPYYPQGAGDRVGTRRSHNTRSIHDSNKPRRQSNRRR